MKKTKDKISFRVSFMIGLLGLVLTGCSKTLPTSPEPAPLIMPIYLDVEEPALAGPTESNTQCQVSGIIDKNSGLNLQIPLGSNTSILKVPGGAVNKDKNITLTVTRQTNTGPSVTKEVTDFSYSPQNVNLKEKAILTYKTSLPRGAYLKLYTYNQKLKGWELVQTAYNQNQKVDFSFSKLTRMRIEGKYQKNLD